MNNGTLKKIINIFVIGESKLEKALSLSSWTMMIILVITGVYWLMSRTYSKYLIALFHILALFAGSLSLRTKALSEKNRAEELARENYEKMGLSLDEAIDYFTSKSEVSLFREWLFMILGILMVSMIIIIVFPQ